MYTDHVHDTKNSMRVPLMNNRVDYDDVGGCINRFLDKLSTRLMRLYCETLPGGKESRDQITGKLLYFYADILIGRHGIVHIFKDGAKNLGIPNYDIFSPRSLRAYFFSKLSNGNGVSVTKR